MLLIGCVVFLIVLFKKTGITDNVASFANPVFDAASGGHMAGFLASWGGALVYSFQLCFDFSGYSDMVIALVLLVGIILPLNFNAPYRATSIIDFWRRWHMTLLRFLRDYFYIPLGRTGAASAVATST